MRLIGKIQDEKLAQRFSSFLLKEKIENHFEPTKDPESEGLLYAIWVYDEDQVDRALQFWNEFSKNPKDSKFDAPFAQPPPPPQETLEEASEPQRIHEPPPIQKRSFGFSMTTFFLVVCGLVYFLNFTQVLKLEKRYPKMATYLLTPIQYSLLYDLSAPLEELREKTIVQKEPITKEAEQTILDMQPMWRGFYWLFIDHFSRNPPDELDASGPTFVKLREGQIWRLFTPCILHRDFLHILFNMIWLWVLGKQMDTRISKWKYVVFVLIAGIVTNTTQYLMSGPLFLGFSGVIAAMAGFIWMRQRISPWEGYTIHRTTFIFLGCFIGLMFLIQLILFVLMMLGLSQFDFNIANTAHISGVLLGMLMGRFSFFSWRPN